MSADAIATFTINGVPPDSATGDRIYLATPGEVLAVTLQAAPTTALAVRYQLFDPLDESSPLASDSAPELNWVENSLPSILPSDVNGTVTVPMPASGINSYIIRATASTPDGPQVFERLVAVPSQNASPAIRKTVPGESTEARARAWSDAFNAMVDAIETLATP